MSALFEIVKLEDPKLARTKHVGSLRVVRIRLARARMQLASQKDPRVGAGYYLVFIR